MTAPKTTLQELIQKLDSVCYQALENGVVLCKNKTHKQVEPTHWLISLLQNSVDLQALLPQAKLSVSTIEQELTETLSKLPTGCADMPSLSPLLFSLLEQAWLMTSLNDAQGKITATTLISAWIKLQNESLQRPASVTLADLDPTVWQQVVQQKPEKVAEDDTSAPTNMHPTMLVLKQYTQNLTELAKAGKLDPVIGRETEID